MYYSLRYYKEELVGPFFTKGVVELAVKFLDKYTYKGFLKTSFLKLKL